MSIFEKKKQPRKQVGLGDFLVDQDAWGDQYPGIFEMLSRCKWKGEGRKGGRLILYCEPNRATLVLCDSDAGEVTFFAADSFGEALGGLEEALQAGSCDWRQDKKSQFKK